MASFLKMFSLPNKVKLEDLGGITCPVCLEIYENPRKIVCGHIFCAQCLHNICDVVEPHCPMCRKTFQPDDSFEVPELLHTIKSSKANCHTCSKEFAASKLRKHYLVCQEIKQEPADDDSDLGATGVTQEVNRHTFKCPLCGVKNFDTHGLRTHCYDQHKGMKAKVVCPICAAMPWGDPTQKSIDFISHLNLRHKVEYDTLVDFNLDEEEALERAIKESLQEHIRTQEKEG